MLTMTEGVVRCTLAQWMEEGPALVRDNPGLVRVELTDKRSDDTDPQSIGFYWFRGLTCRSGLPDAIHDAMRGGGTAGSARVYDTRVDANRYLSSALITWAKAQAVEATHV